ncbi:unnamed protein product [Closterium sp. NIES-64]|nr:unnamed protein product [Closterium sp. NIES-64]
MAKNASKAASPTAASGASCDGDDGDEANGGDAEEDWPENGHDDSASGDDVGPADIEEDDWWNRPVGSDDEVEEWHAGDSDNDGGKDAHGNNAEAAADAQEAAVDANEEPDDEAGAELETLAPADAAAVADAEGEEGGDDDPWSFGTDDDVPLLKRRLRHRLQSKSKRARVVLSDDDGPGEERRPILTAAEKGKAKVAEAPAKAPAKAPARRRTSNKKLTSDGDPGSSKGAAKKKAKNAPNPDDIVVNEPLGSDDEYAAAAGPIPTSTTDVSADMSLGGTTGDNTRLLGRAPEEEEEEAMQAEGVREVAVATGLEVLYQETPNYRGAGAEADRMIEPRETARHAWRVPDLGVEPDVSAARCSRHPLSATPASHLTRRVPNLLPAPATPRFPPCSLSFPPVLHLISPLSPSHFSPCSRSYPPLLPLIFPPSPSHSPPSPSHSPPSPSHFPHFSLALLPLIFPASPAHFPPFSLSLPPLLPLVSLPSPSQIPPFSLSNPPFLPLIPSLLLPLIFRPAPSHFSLFSPTCPPLLPLISLPSPSHFLPFSPSFPALLPLISPLSPPYVPPPLLPLTSPLSPSHFCPCSILFPPLLPLSPPPLLPPIYPRSRPHFPPFSLSHFPHCSPSFCPLLLLTSTFAPSHFHPCRLSLPPLLPLIFPLLTIISPPAPSHFPPFSPTCPPLSTSQFTCPDAVHVHDMQVRAGSGVARADQRMLGLPSGPHCLAPICCTPMPGMQQQQAACAASPCLVDGF